MIASNPTNIESSSAPDVLVNLYSTTPRVAGCQKLEASVMSLAARRQGAGQMSARTLHRDGETLLEGLAPGASLWVYDAARVVRGAVSITRRAVSQLVDVFPA
ncbi:hypothetical protein DL764_009268 [Monosporascus ibericus]|uniref:Uncharacterized protein n=1 Tax=Monosporascus ibericus TaxID=155417 RepID=A0A4Q4SYH8_9PEZI|nr:hypothetical protein DL764_009268 [Monosporascus ibericus]